MTLPATALAWGTLVTAPVLGVLVGSRTAAPVRVAGRAAAWVGLLALAWATSWQFTLRPLKWLALSAGYLAWCLLVGTAFAIRPRALGFTVGGLASLTFVPGFLLGTIGLLGLMFIVGDYARAPAEARTLAPGLDCVVTNWGMAASDDGHDIHLYRYWPALPLMRREVRRVTVNETHPDAATRIATCESETNALAR